MLVGRLPRHVIAGSLALVAGGVAIGAVARGGQADVLLFALAVSTAVVVAVLQQTLP